MFSRLFKRKANDYNKVITAMETWTVACAVGVANGTLGTTMGLESWLRVSKKNWMMKVQIKTGLSERDIEDALRWFVKKNIKKNYMDVIDELEKARGR